MSEKIDLKKAIKKRTLSIDYLSWFGLIVFSTFVGIGFLPFLMIAFQFLGLKITPLLKNISYLIIPSLIIIAYYKNLKFVFIKTNLSKTKSKEQLIILFEKLNWEVFFGYDYFYLGKNNFLLNMLDMKVIPTKDGVLINLRYKDHHRGRIPFFIGIRTYYKHLLIKEIKKIKVNN